MTHGESEVPVMHLGFVLLLFGAPIWGSLDAQVGMPRSALAGAVSVEAVRAPGEPALPQVDSGWTPYDYKATSHEARGPSSGALVVLAFGVIWLVLFGYVVLLGRRQRKIAVELEALRALLLAPESSSRLTPAEEPRGPEGTGA